MRLATILRSTVALCGVGAALTFAARESKADSPSSSCNPLLNGVCEIITIPDFICVEVGGQLECEDLVMPIFGERSAT